MAFLKIYQAGKYILKKESLSLGFFRGLFEYMGGLTLARSSINRLKPNFIFSKSGDILEIGGYDDFFKRNYKAGKFLNLDIKSGPHVDIVANAEDLTSIAEASFSAVICISVLEHTDNPEKIIEEIFRILKPGGQVFLSTPWMFESHMAPQDFYRFSENFYHLPQNKKFKINTTENTNGYFGLLAHFCQHNLFLRITIGLFFLMLDKICRKPTEFKWSTQITLILSKPL